MERSTLLVGTIFISSFFLIITLWNETSYPRFKSWNETSHPRFKPWNETSNRTEIASDRTCFSNDTKIILFYTAFFGDKPWPTAKSTEEYLSKCPTKKCKITYDVRDIGKSDLVIFHVRDILRSVTSEKIQQIHKNRSPQQRKAFLTHESIVN